MKITLEQGETKITIEEPGNDQNISEIMRIIKRLVIGAGYPEQLVEEYLGE